MIPLWCFLEAQALEKTLVVCWLHNYTKQSLCKQSSKLHTYSSHCSVFSFIPILWPCYDLYFIYIVIKIFISQCLKICFIPLLHQIYCIIHSICAAKEFSKVSSTSIAQNLNSKQRVTMIMGKQKSLATLVYLGSRQKMSITHWVFKFSPVFLNLLLCHTFAFQHTKIASNTNIKSDIVTPWVSNSNDAWTRGSRVSWESWIAYQKQGLEKHLSLLGNCVSSLNLKYKILHAVLILRMDARHICEEFHLVKQTWIIWSAEPYTLVCISSSHTNHFTEDTSKHFAASNACFTSLENTGQYNRISVWKVKWLQRNKVW